METRIENWNGYDIRFINLDGDWYAVLKDICDALRLQTLPRIHDDPKSVLPMLNQAFQQESVRCIR